MSACNRDGKARASKSPGRRADCPWLVSVWEGILETERAVWATRIPYFRHLYLIMPFMKNFVHQEAIEPSTPRS